MSANQRQLGDFLLEKKLGQGGMGEVYKARQVSLDRVVAVKILPKSLAAQENFIERFQREAKAAANLIHPNVIQIYSIGVESGTPYFAMEFVEGDDLQQRMKRVGKLSYDESVDIVIGVSNALAVAFEKGIVHRDIKPSNIMLDKSGVVKVMDFGLAKATSGEGSNSLTQSGLIMGTPNYISPEQGKGEQIDSRSDIYSLGVVFFEFLSGKLPFRADTPAALIYKHAYEPPPPLQSLDPQVPPFLAEIAMRMLAKEPRERYPNPKALLADLNEFRRNMDYYLRGGARRTPAITGGSSSSGSISQPPGAMAEAQTLAGVPGPSGPGSGQFGANASYSGPQPPGGSGFRRADTMPDQNPGQTDRGAATMIETGPAGSSSGMGKLVVGAVLFIAIGVGFWMVLGKKLWGPAGSSGITGPLGNPRVEGAPGTVTFALSRLEGRIPKGVTSELQVNTSKIYLATRDQPFNPSDALTMIFTKRGYKPLFVPIRVISDGVTDPPLESVKFQFELSDDLQGTLDAANANFKRQHYRDAMAQLETVTLQAPDYEPAVTLKNNIERFLDEFRDDARKGEEAMRLHKWQEARDVLDKIPESADEYPAAHSRSGEASIKITSLENDKQNVQLQLNSGNFEQARRTIAELRNLLPPDDPIPDAAEAEIRDAEDALANARRERDNKQWQKALEYADAVLKIAPGHQEAGQIQKDARTVVNESLSTEEKIETGIKDGEQALKDGQAQKAADAAQRVLVLAKDNKVAQDLLNRALLKVTEAQVVDAFATLDRYFLERKLSNLLERVDSSGESKPRYDALQADLQAFFAAPLELKRAEHGDFQVTRQGDDGAQAETTWTLEMGFPEVKGSSTPAHEALTIKIRQRVKMKHTGAGWTFVLFEQVGERIVQ